MNTIEALKKLWDYLVIADKPQSSDAIFVLGRDDFYIPQRAIELFRKKLAPVILVTGGIGRLTGSIKGTEAATFRDYMLASGVPAQNILLEEASTNTSENIEYGLKILKTRVSPKRIILVTHGPHMRRALAVARVNDETIEWLAVPDVCEISSVPEESLVKELLGEIDRLVQYPKLGYFSNQNIPSDILATRQLLKQESSRPTQ